MADPARAKRLAKRISTIVASAIEYEIKDPRLNGVTITDAKMTGDLHDATLQIGRSGRHISQEAIQLHGGIGVTAEYPVGHYAARLTAIEHTLGSSSDQLRTLVGQLDSYEIATL